ncbi:hypothetical protein A5764_22675 [Mycobacterium sp. 852002-51057_SCH5723018]|nr:hypothetical protein A5764_22675 [Mycobacterium sp. 852002-51057_SCH5723018]
MWPKHIHDDIARHLRDGGCASLSDTVGSAAPKPGRPPALVALVIPIGPELFLVDTMILVRGDEFRGYSSVRAKGVRALEQSRRGL